MGQLPLFVNLGGAPVILIGTGEAADAKRRLIERAGGIACANDACPAARIGFVAVEDEEEALTAAARLRARGLLVNVVDRPAHCDFTTPAIVERGPVLIAVGTGGASAGLAKAVRQRIEAMLPATLGRLAEALAGARGAMVARWPGAAERRRAIDAALADGGALDPLRTQDADAVTRWLAAPGAGAVTGLHVLLVDPVDPDALTLGQARLLGQADAIFHDAAVDAAVLSRARADAARHLGSPPPDLPPGLILHMRAR